MNTIISIDWDHTLRNTAGIDLNILALVIYAQTEQIPVGLTTHRDLENTTLYTLYDWQHGKSGDSCDALAASISYWDEHLFKPLNITFDFINARYQPRHEGINYYQDILFPLEKKLAQEIMENDILSDPRVVNAKIREYAQPERLIEHNEYKETQVLWLSDFYKQLHAPVTLCHIDDSKAVCDQLPETFSELQHSSKFNVKTFHYESSPLFSNESIMALLIEIGLLRDLRRFLDREQVDALLHHPRKCLSLAMVALFTADTNNDVFSIVEYVLQKINLSENPGVSNFYFFVQNLLTETQRKGRPIWIMPNSLKF